MFLSYTVTISHPRRVAATGRPDPAGLFVPHYVRRVRRVAPVQMGRQIAAQRKGQRRVSISSPEPWPSVIHRLTF
ncbi:protein of unknown function [Candidatus Promineifilum breve]|uniref:Uncharacterized protein n=1 Tax=Candidatus Promineifilum breve TaxID=1806508 RepID=A0A160T0D9_9CHLR|nr:protein of unknown function [Candidatus Promineifilum breve]